MNYTIYISWHFQSEMINNKSLFSHKSKQVPADMGGAERAAIQADGQAHLAGIARELATTPEDRAEAERLIALPYGAEGNALRMFVMALRELSPCA